MLDQINKIVNYFHFNARRCEKTVSPVTIFIKLWNMNEIIDFMKPYNYAAIVYLQIRRLIMTWHNSGKSRVLFLFGRVNSLKWSNCCHRYASSLYLNLQKAKK